MGGLLARGPLRIFCTGCGRGYKRVRYRTTNTCTFCGAPLRNETLLEQRERRARTHQMMADARESFAIRRLADARPTL